MLCTQFAYGKWFFKSDICWRTEYITTHVPEFFFKSYFAKTKKTYVKS